jgi:hypothetical protein
MGVSDQVCNKNVISLEEMYNIKTNIEEFITGCKHESIITVYVSKLVELLYEDLKECCGGLLHIVLDDGNLEDDNLQWCIDNCNKPENENRIDKYLCLEIAHKMLQMDEYQRRLIYYGSCNFECDNDCKDCVIEHEEEY